MPKYDYLTASEKMSISHVVGGADVMSLILAQQLRSIEKKQKANDHQLIDITHAMGTYNAIDRTPYFGCIALSQGEEAAQEPIL